MSSDVLGSADPASWWERWPGLYNNEMAAFARHNVEPRIILKERGLIMLEGEWNLPGKDPIKLRIGFSPFHPFCRPAVSAPEVELERHQHPFSRSLCLIPQEAGQWDSRQCVADFVAEQVGNLLNTLEARRAGDWDAAAQLEEHTPDPLTPYYASLGETGSIALYDGHRAMPAGNCGVARFMIRARPHPDNPRAIELLLQGLDSIGSPPAPNFSLPNEPDGAQQIFGRWVRMTPPLTEDPNELLAAAEAAMKAATMLEPKARAPLQRVRDTTDSVTVIVFPDDANYEDRGVKKGVGYLFLISRGDGGRRSKLRQTSLIKGEMVSEEVFARVPAAAAVRQKKILLVGCGAVGSFAALELARLGAASITLWDNDIVRPGNSVRWPFGRAAWGISKTRSLASFIFFNNPWTRPLSVRGHIGGTTSDPADVSPNGDNQFTVVRRAIGEVDLVIDTTGSTEAQQALAHTAEDLGVAYIVGYSTLGAAGGVVGTIPKNSSSCLICMLEHWGDRALPEPPVREDGEIVMGGCNSLTFTGSSFDLQEVSLQVVRRAVEVLSGQAAEHDLARLDVLSLQDERGDRTLPSWETAQVEPHVSCLRCSV